MLQAPLLQHHKLSSTWGQILTSLLHPTIDGLGIRGPSTTPDHPDPMYLTPTADPANPMVHVTIALASIPDADLLQLWASFGDPDWNHKQEEAAHMAAGLEQPDLCGLDCQSTFNSAALVVDISASWLRPVLVWLARCELAVWISPRYRIQTHNYFA